MGLYFYLFLVAAIIGIVYYVIRTWLPNVAVQSEGTHIHVDQLDQFNHKIIYRGQHLMHYSDGEWTETKPKGRLHKPLGIPYDNVSVSGEQICISGNHLQCGHLDDNYEFVTDTESMKQSAGIPIPNNLFLTSVYPWQISNGTTIITEGNFNPRPLDSPTNWIEIDDDHYLLAASFTDKSVFLDKTRAVFIKVKKTTFCPVAYTEPICLEEGCKPQQKITSLTMFDDNIRMTMESQNILEMDSDAIRGLLP